MKTNKEKLIIKLGDAIEELGLETDFKDLSLSDFLGAIELVKLNYFLKTRRNEDKF